MSLLGKANHLTIEIDPADYGKIKSGLFSTPTLTVQFNPQTFDYAWKVNWSNKDKDGKELNTLQFQNVDKRSFTLSLVFDAREAGVFPPNVRALTRPFELLAKPIVAGPSDGTPRPPFITVSWGGAVERIRGILSSFGQQYTLFSKTGVPLRSRVTLAVEEYVDSEKALKEFRAGDPEEFLTIGAGDTLPNIAFKEYGDASLWRALADANGLDDPRALAAGLRLYIPALESIKK